MLELGFLFNWANPKQDSHIVPYMGLMGLASWAYTTHTPTIRVYYLILSEHDTSKLRSMLEWIIT
jgi:hypothetical protein